MTEVRDKKAQHKLPGERLQKVLSRQGVGSRRQIEQLMKEGRISVDGVKATVGMRVLGKELIRIDGRRVRQREETDVQRAVIAYHKTEGEVCTRSDPEGRPTVFSRLPTLKRSRWINVGRLDINTSGLLLFTNDGELANKLMHPSSQIEREYAVRVFGEVTPEHISQLINGVTLEDGPAHFSDIVASGGEGINRWFHVCLAEGRNREVRRLWESQGLNVNRLKRVRFGSFMLPLKLRKNQFCYLNQKEVDALCKLVNLPSKPVMVHKNRESDKRLLKKTASWSRTNKKSARKTRSVKS
ncbi:MAG: pseudouridine synthase [Endozoicomonadaceae bacterium]|nr:pseudouridine synthase [Endozoicomonadaceae bacterium]